MTDVAGVLDREGAVLPQLTSAEIEARIAAGEITGGMVPKVRSAIATANDARIPVTIASWRDAAKIEGIARGQWIGTRIVPDVSAPASGNGVTRNGASNS